MEAYHNNNNNDHNASRRFYHQASWGVGAAASSYLTGSSYLGVSGSVSGPNRPPPQGSSAKAQASSGGAAGPVMGSSSTFYDRNHVTGEKQARALANSLARLLSLSRALSLSLEL